MKIKLEFDSWEEVADFCIKYVKDGIVEEKKEYKTALENTELPTAIVNALRKGGYESVEEVVKASDEDLKRVKRLGKKTVERIRMELRNFILLKDSL